MSVNDTNLASDLPNHAQIRKRYEADGYYIFRNVLDPDLVSSANDHVDWLLQRHPELRPFELGHTLARTDPFWHRLVADSRLLDIAEIFLGPDIALFASHYICKEPRAGRQVKWHQDGAFWPIRPMEVITQWLAITPSTTENGCLKVVPGSHLIDLMAMIEVTSDDAVLAEEIPVDVAESEAVPLVLQPGDLSVHHPNIFHSSDANTSPDWRRGLTIRYIPTTTRILDPEAASPFLLRGSPVPGVNDYLPVPVFESDIHMAFE